MPISQSTWDTLYRIRHGSEMPERYKLIYADSGEGVDIFRKLKTKVSVE